MAEKPKAVMKWQEAQKLAAADLKRDAGEDKKFNTSPFTTFAKNLMYGRNTAVSRAAALATAKVMKTALKKTVKRSSAEKKLSRQEKQRILREAGIPSNAITIARFTTLRKNKSNSNALNALRAEKMAKKAAAPAAGPKPLTAAQRFAAEQRAAREAFKAAQVAEREAAKATRTAAKAPAASLEKCYQKCRDIQAKKAVTRGEKALEKEAKKAEKAAEYEAARGAMPSGELHTSLLNKLEANGINVGKIRSNSSRMNKFTGNPIVKKWKTLKRTNGAEANTYYAEKVLPTFEGYAAQVKKPKGGSRRKANSRRNMTRRRRN